MNDFADELTRCRDAAGLTMIELARRSGLDKAMISRLESRQRQPSRETIAKLADGLDLGDASSEERQARVALFLSAGYVPGGFVVTGLERVLA